LHAASWMLLARWGLWTRFRTRRASQATRSFDRTSALAAFTAKSLRRLATFKCCLASLFLALVRLLDPFFFRESRRESCFSRFSALRSGFGQAILSPLESV